MYTINGFNTYIINNGFDVSKVTSMNSMFENASSFTGCAADLWGRAADLRRQILEHLVVITLL